MVSLIQNHSWVFPRLGMPQKTPWPLDCSFSKPYSIQVYENPGLDWYFAIFHIIPMPYHPVIGYTHSNGMIWHWLMNNQDWTEKTQSLGWDFLVRFRHRAVPQFSSIWVTGIFPQKTASSELGGSPWLGTAPVMGLYITILTIVNNHENHHQSLLNGYFRATPIDGNPHINSGFFPTMATTAQVHGARRSFSPAPLASTASDLFLRLGRAWIPWDVPQDPPCTVY